MFTRIVPPIAWVTALAALAACADMARIDETAPGVHEYRVKTNLLYMYAGADGIQWALADLARRRCGGDFTIADQGVRSIPGTDESEHVWRITCAVPPS